MNYITVYGKIVNISDKIFVESANFGCEDLIFNTYMREITLEFVQNSRKTRFNIVKVAAWEEFSNIIFFNYNVNDFILIEGYITYRENIDYLNVIVLNRKIVPYLEITVCKVFLPFTLDILIRY
jgi:hypothetical protein